MIIENDRCKKVNDDYYVLYLIKRIERIYYVRSMGGLMLSGLGYG
jgi:hypothetical protein